eukprot:3969964-Pleurochrysis_carterae.AAC.2
MSVKSARRDAVIRENMDFVLGYMREHRLQKDLQTRIRRFYNYYYAHRPLLNVEACTRRRISVSVYIVALCAFLHSRFVAACATCEPRSAPVLLLAWFDPLCFVPSVVVRFMSSLLHHFPLFSRARTRPPLPRVPPSEEIRDTQYEAARTRPLDHA